MVSFLKKLFQRRTSAARSVSLEDVTGAREGAAALDDVALVHSAKKARTLPEVIGVTAVVASRVLGLQMFDEQLMASVALAHGEVVEMQTGEGKTLAAVPAIAWLARRGGGVHVLTANDYLARRDGPPIAPTSPTRPRARSDLTCFATASRSIGRRKSIADSPLRSSTRPTRF